MPSDAPASAVDDASLLRRFRQARFLLSTPGDAGLPADEGRELAFAGRSNAGKSSAINAIVDQHGLARTSKTPGRTQHLVVFELESLSRLIDLPGYGYAKVPQQLKLDWHQQIDAYVSRRRSLAAIVVVSDIRQALTDFDRQMLVWCRSRALPCVLLLSKADKLNRGPALQARRRVEQEIASLGVATSVLVFSAQAGQGVAEARRLLAGMLGWGTE